MTGVAAARLALAMLTLALAAAVGPASRAQPPAGGQPPDRTASEIPPEVPHAWATVVDAEHGFALRLPPTHDLARAGTIWYVHGWLDGTPLVPDVSLTLLTDRTLDEALAEFPDGAVATRVALGPDTHGLRVVAPYRAEDGTPYEGTAYLVEAPAGTYRISPYEDFVWEPFHAVARSFHLVRDVDAFGRR